MKTSSRPKALLQQLLTYLIVCLFFLGLQTPAWSVSHHPQDFLRQIAGAKDEGAQIVQHYCANCHALKPIIQIGAPRMGFSSDWSARLKQGMDGLFKHTDEGFNAMPARGGCFECSDKQLLLAIQALLPQTPKKDF